MGHGFLRSSLVLTNSLFLYGTLCDPALYGIVAGTEHVGRKATLQDASVHWVKGENFPILINESGSKAEGTLVEVDQTIRQRLDFYETGFGYDVETRTVETLDGDVQASVYIPKNDWQTGAAWSLEDWQKDYGRLSRVAAEDYMRLIGTHAPAEAARAFPQIRMRAASRLRALAGPSPTTLMPKTDNAAVRSEDMQRPYTDYFAVQEDHLSFPLFDGGESPVVKRASFLGGDAVTILPYDPRLDKVLMVRQFRHGPYARGDTNPWTLEPAAGRIDPGEDPEETARRELVEETGLIADRLHLVGRYYPSPGAYSEYLYSYVATADLSDRDGGIGGLAEEAEDIMAHVISLNEAVAMIETGEANTGPLILSLSWLARNCDKLR